MVDWHNRYGNFLHSAILTGLLSGYTTFSSLQLDAAKLVNQKQAILAASYLMLSVLSCLLAAAMGAWLAY
ncbi:fluoride efflux transporter FluC [Entomomonas moraniae]|uniref:fluoride efflux transporter FluC n=1 Tax=Entomomonas moraniae TaxID=2213226 RepID=UPI001E46CBC4|nr:CrcB family protein [Entomomonas moraniae]